MANGTSKARHLNVAKSQSGFRLAPELLLKMHDLMVKTRVLEERLIKMYKQNDGFFWIGGPGEEAFNVALGLLIRKGSGPKFDYFHGHYRSAGVLLAMGAEPLDFIRQMKCTAADPFSGGRNFIGHSSIRKWNVVPISSPIEVQFSMAPGTAMANKRAGKAITIVVGGDAGSAEGDFSTALVWSSRPADPLPLLMVVTNNKWGISTPAEGQHGDRLISERGTAFGIRSETFNGNDPEEAYVRLKEVMEYVRAECRPALIEAFVSRLYGHSSASGANFVTEEEDPIKIFETRLEREGLISRKQIEAIWTKYGDEMLKHAQQARHEPQPDPESIWDHVYCGQKGRTGRYV